MTDDEAALQAIKKDFREAVDLMRYFKARGLQPSDVPFIMAAFNASMLVQAKIEGKPTTIEDFTETYKESLELYYPIALSLVMTPRSS